MIELTLPYPPSANRYYRYVNGRVLISKEGRAYRDKVSLHVIQQLPEEMLFQHPPAFKAKLWVEIDAHPPDRRRRDIDNLHKPLLDAMENAGVYRDDSQIKRLRTDMCERVKGGKVVVRIKEMEAAK